MFGMVNFGSIITDVEREQQQITTEFKKLETWNQDGLFRTIDPEQVDNTIIIPVNGQYNVSFTISFKGTNERNYTLSLFQDGVEIPEIQATRFFGPNLKTGDMSFEGVINVSSAPSTIDVRAKCDISDANVMIVENAVLSCFDLPPASTGEDNTASNVGGEKEVFKQKVLEDLEFRTLKEGPNITITQNTDDLEIASTSVSAPSFFTQSHNTVTISSGINFIMVEGGNSGEANEIDRQTVVPSDCTLKRLGVQVSSQRNGISVITLRINGVDGNQSVSIPAGATGFFQDLVNTDSISAGDLLAYKVVRGGGSGSWTIVATAMEITN